MFAYIEDRYGPEKYWGAVECQRIIKCRDIGHAPTDFEFVNAVVLRCDTDKLKFTLPFRASDWKVYEYETFDDLFNAHMLTML